MLCSLNLPKQIIDKLSHLIFWMIITNRSGRKEALLVILGMMSISWLTFYWHLNTITLQLMSFQVASVATFMDKSSPKWMRMVATPCWSQAPASRSRTATASTSGGFHLFLQSMARCPRWISISSYRLPNCKNRKFENDQIVHYCSLIIVNKYFFAAPVILN